MNAPRPEDTPASAADRRLRRNLREALDYTPADGLHALELRALAQWRERCDVPPRRGPLATMRARWHQHRLLYTSALLALGVAGLFLARSVVTTDAGVEELMQPDVLSLISMGEL